MVVIEIDPNANCEPVDMRVFHDLSPAARVSHVRLEREPGCPAWFELTGWTADGAPCPALAQKVDDSGDGIALLVRGGDAGLRFRPEADTAAWSLEAAAQWGESFLLIADEHDLRICDARPAAAGGGA